MIVLGIDVGLRVSGYVVCKMNETQVNLIKEGEVKTKFSKNLPKRLLLIYEEFSKVINDYKPQAVILEKLYSHYRHPTTVALLSQVRGVILLLIEKHGLNFFDYSSTKARKSFLGKGNAESFQVKKMAENILGRKLFSQHTADAYSLVVAFSHTQKLKRLEDDWKNKG